MEDHRVHTEDELGLPYVAKFKLDLPMIVSVGTAYSGFEDLVLAVDLRYFDCANTDGVGDQRLQSLRCLERTQLGQPVRDRDRCCSIV